MGLLDCIKLSFIKIFRDKKKVYYFILLILSFLILNSALSFGIAYFNNLKLVEKSDVNERKIIIAPSTDKPNDYVLTKLDDINNIKHVQEAITTQMMVAVNAEEFNYGHFDGMIELIYGSENTLPQNIIGERYKSDDTGVVICPVNFFPGSMDKFPSEENDIFIDGNELLNKTIEVSSDTYIITDKKTIPAGKYTKKLKVVGLYDPNEVDGYLFQCYASGKDIQDIYSNTMGVFTSDEESQKRQIQQAVVIVDEFENIKSVKNELVNMGFRVSDVIVRDIEYENSIKYTCAFIILVVIIGIIIITLSYEKKKNTDDSSEIGVLKAIGYSRKDILLTNTITTFIITLLAYIIGVFIFFILITLIRTFYKDYLIFTGHGFYLKQYFTTYFISFLLITFPAVGSSLLYTNSKKSTISIIKGNTK